MRDLYVPFVVGRLRSCGGLKKPQREPWPPTWSWLSTLVGGHQKQEFWVGTLRRVPQYILVNICLGRPLRPVTLFYETTNIKISNKYQMLIIMIRPKPRTGERRSNASGHIKRCDVKMLRCWCLWCKKLYGIKLFFEQNNCTLVYKWKNP